MPDRLPSKLTLTAKLMLSTTLVLGLVGSVMSCGDDDAPPYTGGSGCALEGKKCPFGCDENLGCVSCLADADCGAGKPWCIRGKCVECVVATDCAAGQSCFPREHKCEPKCSNNGDCGKDEPICDPVTKGCVGCLSSGDCGGKEPLCEPSRAQCGDCVSNLDCGTNKPICDLQDGKCNECLVDHHCPYGNRCAPDRKCHFYCTSNSECADARKPLCNFDRNDCVECLTGADCPFALPLCKNSDKCVECLGDVDCPPALPFCKGDACVMCDKNEDCPPTAPVCKDNTCVQ